MDANEADSNSFVSENNDSVDGEEEDEGEEEEEDDDLRGTEPEVNGVAETDEDEEALLGEDDPMQVWRSGVPKIKTLFKAESSVNKAIAISRVLSLN